MSLEAGLDLRSIFQREIGRIRGFGTRGRIEAVSDAIDRGESLGESLGEALAEAGEFFPPLVREVVGVGEHSGRLAEAFAQLADQYEAQLNFRRKFLAALAWPILELTATVAIIGVMIWAPAAIAGSAAIDFLGLGLGNKALVRYLLCVGVVAMLFAVLVHAWRRSLAWTRPIQRVLWRLPGIGGPIRLMALARLTWAMELTFYTGMNVRRALRLSLESSQAAHFTDQIAPSTGPWPRARRSTRRCGTLRRFRRSSSTPCTSARRAASCRRRWAGSRPNTAAGRRRP